MANTHNTNLGLRKTVRLSRARTSYCLRKRSSPAQYLESENAAWKEMKGIAGLTTSPNDVDTSRYAILCTAQAFLPGNE
ncbi:uncharacterized protein CLUP02_15663 [Colletotrichum lupini]|uniref:Uncharacterized protein n=1 Tax=Colletotrichum lupini TaxID=145971 RepID=A0A9Q8T6P0_9PEZI|nr:uncharacterized protein CLUP02_15663 [Colletotrichum lupini]UQC90132.1 hypothetical protein CLUP02_15663 [Colletotrichum lupini]